MSGKDFGKVINQSVAATVNSDWLDMLDMDSFSVHAAYGAITGVLHVEVTNDVDDVDMAPETVSEISFDALAGAGKQVIEVSNARSRYYRVCYVHASGTGKLKAVVIGKKGS
jgi:hypothetical protein